jgi:glycosyltransferase involved in cell wall biosynthesis
VSDVSIIIPTRNRPEIFQRALRCALDQTHPAAEIIVADNSTNDETEQVVKANSHKTIRYIRTDENLGMLGNWYSTVDEAQSPWLKFCFDDDWIDPTFIERTLEVATPQTQVVVTGGLVHMPQGANAYCVGSNTPPQRAHLLCASGVLTVSPNGALSRREAIDYARSVMDKLHPDCTSSGIGPDVVTNYAITTKYPDSWVQIPDVIAHYDGRYGSFTIKTLETNPNFLHECYAKAHQMMRELWAENQPST